MWMERNVTALALALLLGACSRGPEQTAALPADLQRDLATATTTGGDLATAPQRYQRVRFVSDIEQTRSAALAKRPTMAHHHARPATSRTAAQDAAPDAMDAMMSESPAPAPASTPEAAAPEPAEVVSSQPAPAPPSSSTGSTSDVGVEGRGHDGGLGGLLGGIIGAVVIRGGHVGVDKCDPRTHGRARPQVDLPVFGMPLPTGQPTFPGGGRHR